MIFVPGSAFWRRRQCIYADRAAFEAEYAGMVTAGTWASRVPVKINAVGSDFFCRWGRNFIDRSTSLLKLVLISSWKASRSTSVGLDNRTWLWVPELRKTQSRLGYSVVTLLPQLALFLQRKREAMA